MTKSVPDGGFSILLGGVGGQGLVMLSNIIGKACAETGARVITGEQHGLSQRSGTISVHLRIGESVRSPLIPVGSGDALLSLEALEALRYVEYLKDGGIVLANNRIMHPVSETGEMVKDKSKQYFGTKDVESRLREVTSSVLFIDALGLAAQAGNPIAENMVMLGALGVLEQFPVPPEALRDAIVGVVPPGAREANIRAFALGAKAARDGFCSTVACRKI
jgi:indolepyruvate ferredoxin oxidoreductase beta subunit